jgi:chemotaxis protein methyltransferase CheR
MALSRSAFECIRDFLAKEVGIVLEESRIDRVEAQLLPLIQRYRFSSANELIRTLMAGFSHGLQTDVIAALVSTNSDFFRDMRVFEHLQTNILPELERKRSPEKKLRIWSAACATGQEPFSVAMLIREYFPQWKDWEVEIVGSDVSRSALSRAQRGRYDQQEINRGLPARFFLKYFHQEGPSCYVVDEVFSMVHFREFNLLGDWPALPEMDLILLRNVLSEMNSEARKVVLEKMSRQVKKDGCLVIGGQETVSELAEWFRAEELDKVVTYRLAW